MQTINIIGAGKLGQSLARLWHDLELLQIGGVMNQSLQSARQAVEHVGAGTPASSWDQLPPANIWLLSSNDTALPTLAGELAHSGLLRPGDLVMHCSGAYASNILALCRAHNAETASVHPAMSFPQAFSRPEQLESCRCCCEGSDLSSAIPLFEALGCHCLEIDPAHKALYHAATVLACNYLNTLTAQSIQLLEQAGIPSEHAPGLLAPLMQSTLENIRQLGPGPALTGPIARGDHDCIRRHLEALSAQAPETLALYRELGRHTLALSPHQKALQQEGLFDHETG